MSLAPLVAGALVGAGLLAVVRGLVPARVSLAESLRSLEPAAGASAAAPAGWDVTGRAGHLLRSVYEGLHISTESVARDLRVVGKPLDAYLAEKVFAALVGVLLPQATAFAGRAAYGAPRGLLPLWASMLLGVGGFVVPDLSLRGEAAQRRRSFRFALGSFLDLVVISLAGGGGVESALSDAAAVGTGWAFEELRGALEDARLRRDTPWAALARLGEQLGVPELSELAASVGLAGTEGARVRASLEAKAASLRTHEVAAAEAEAESASERMNLPIAVLFLGFLVFLGYPAVERIVAGI